MILTARLLWLPNGSKVIGGGMCKTSQVAALSSMWARPLTTASTQFENLGLSKTTSQRLSTVFNINEPTVMQRQLIPAIVSGKDILLKDTTGTGKSFAIATSLVDMGEPALYVVPNRELALQISGWVEKLTPDSPAQLIIAGEDRQMDDKTCSHLTIGTASKMWSLIEHGQWENKTWKTIVVDEADQAFRLPGRYAHWKKTWIRKAHPKPAESVVGSIMASQTSKPQVIIASATMNRPLRHWLLEKQWIKDAVYINGQSPASGGVQHHCLVVSSDQVRNIETQIDETVAVHMATEEDIDESVMECLETLCSIEPVTQGVIFVPNDGRFSQTLCQLQNNGIDAIPLYEAIAHGTQAQFYVATAMTGRGIDLHNISHVFIVGLSKSIDDYMHMAGRLGRLGQTTGSGKVITIAKESKYVESKVNSMFKLMNTPITMYRHVQ